MLSRLFSVAFIYSILQVTAVAAECSAIFPDAVQNNDDGFISFKWNSKLIDNPDTTLESVNLIDYNSSDSVLNCGTDYCDNSGFAVEQINYGSFDSGGADLSYSYQDTASPPPGAYGTFNPDKNTELTITLSSGDYSFSGDFYLKHLNKLIINDSGGPVRIFVKGIAEIDNQAELNTGGNPTSVLLYLESTLTINAVSPISAFIYNKKNITLNSGVSVIGGISAQNITLESVSTVTFDDTILDTDDLCNIQTTPSIDYCETTFVNGATSWSDNQDGSITFEGTPTIYNDKNGVLESKLISGDDTDSLSCENNADGSINRECTATGTDTQQLDIGDYIEGAGGPNFNNITGNVTLGSGTGSENTNSFTNIKVSNGGDLTFSSENFSTYYIKTLEVLKNDSSGTATLNLAPGEYHIGTLSADGNTTITITSPGEVRIIVENASSFLGNVKANIDGTPEDFLIYSEDDFNLENTVEVHGLIYTENNADMLGSAVLVGAISSRSVRLRGNSEIYYSCETIIPPTVTAPILDYHFDKCTYDGTPGEVTDHIGSFNGDTFGVPSPISDSVINNSLDLTANGTSDWITAPATSVNGLNDLSLSFWFKMDGDEMVKFPITQQTRPVIFHAVENGVGDNDELMVFLHTATELRLRVNDRAITFDDVSNLIDNTWKHIAVTREGAEFCLFLNGVNESCSTVNQSVGILEVNTPIPFGQKQQANGNFSSNRNFEGKLDEFKIFDSALDSDEITDIYANELAENNYDGTSREKSECIIDAKTEYRFDELLYSEAEGEVIDSIGGAHGQAIGSQTLSGKVCSAIDLRAEGVDDFAVLDSSVLSGKTDFSISYWAKSEKSGNQSMLSGANSARANELLMFFETDVLFALHLLDADPGDDAMISISDNEWHHFVWIREGEQNCLYTDTILQGCQTLPDDELPDGVLATDPLSIQALILGQDQDSVYDSDLGPGNDNGGFDDGQGAESLIDELVIFDSAISQRQIEEIYDNQNAGLGYDGSDRDCPLPEPILNMWFDEPSWFGSDDDIIDQTGNFEATAYNGATTEQTTPARAGNPGTCGYGAFDGSNDYVQIPHEDGGLLNLLDELTITTWIYPTQYPSGGLKTILSKDENYEFHLTSSGEIFWWWGNGSFTTSDANITLNNWHHIAITYKDGEQIIYINGVNRGKATYSGQLPQNSDPFQVGQDQGYGGRYFPGSIDEVRVYSRVLSPEHVVDIYEETHPCSSVVDHFQIDVIDGQGLTCEPDTINIKACAESSCNIVNAEAFTVTLSVSDGNGNVVLTKGVTVQTEFGVNVDYIHTANEVVSLSLDQTFKCINGSPDDCDVTFSDAGFKFVESNDNTELPIQLSGKPSNTGYNLDTLTIKAVKTDDSGACAPLLITGESIQMGASYENPISASDPQQVNISGDNAGSNFSVDIGMNDFGTDFESLTFTDVPLDFGDDTQSSANYIFTYPDAGSVKLYARYKLPDDDDAVTSSNEFIEGTSAPIIVRPFAFDVYVDNNVDPSEFEHRLNPQAEDADGDAFIAAGANMAITTRAVVWEAADDGDNDGVADSGAVLSGNTTTKNFTDISLDSLSYSRVAPIPGVDGTLEVTDGGNFIDGVKKDTATYDEVGIIAITTDKNNYIATGVNITGGVPHVGRFIPAYFTQTVSSHGALNANHYDTCLNNSWAYAGQTRESGALTLGAISYDNLLPEGTPVIEINAFNLAGNLTQNYSEGDFMKLDKADIEITSPTHDDEILRLFPSVADEKVMLTANISVGDDLEVTDTRGKGVVNYTFNEGDHFYYEHNKHSQLPPFAAKIPFEVTAVEDSDGVELYEGSDTSIEPTEKVVTEGVEIRFGRWVLDNSYGPETSTLSMDMKIQHLGVVNTENKFINNADENCLIPEIGNAISSGNIGDAGLALWDYRLVDLDSSDTLLPSHTALSVDDEEQSFLLGLYQSLLFAPPGNNRQGGLEFEYQVPTWLQYDWNNDEDFTNNPSATLTFGIFRGNDRIIYQREVEKVN